jgi:SAM-dependent methyltransferase
MIKSKSYASIYNEILGGFVADFAVLKQIFDGRREKPLIELGAGTGRVLSASLNDDLILVESDPEMLMILEKSIAKSTKKAMILESDVCSLPLLDSTISGAFILCSSISEFSPIYFAMSELSRVLEKGAYLVCFVLNLNFVGANNRGIRSVNYSGNKIGCSLQLFRDKNVIPYGYQVEFRIQEDLTELTFNIKQYHLEITEWIKFIERAGFKLDRLLDGNGSEFLPEHSEVAAMVFRNNKNAEAKDEYAEKMKDFYNKFADNYNEITQTARYAGPSLLENFALRFADCSPKVLDLGCGNGLVGKVLKSKGASGKVFGIDLSEKMCAEARESGYYFSVAQADLSMGLPFIESFEFDLVTAFGVMEFLPEHSNLLKCIHRLLRRGGETWLTFEKSVPGWPESGVPHPENGVVKYHYQTPEILCKLLEEIGFEEISIREEFAYLSPSFNIEVNYFVVRARRGVD